MPILPKKFPGIFPNLTPNFLADPKSNERVFRFMEKVIRLCQDDRIQLKNSPPYILEILPELYPLLQTAIKHVLTELAPYNVSNDKYFLHGNSASNDMPIFLPDFVSSLWDKYKIPENLANAAIYLKLFLTNIYLKCRDIVQMFKEDENFVELSDPRSKPRERLSHISLILSNMWKEFEAMFSVNVQEERSAFVGRDFKVTKQEGQIFWDQVFPSQCIVHWSHFVKMFANAKNDFVLVSSEESNRLRETFDITENGYVSIFEFDIFVRLFHPFRNLVYNWNQITSHPAYMGFKTYDEVCAILGKHTDRPGSYVFRVSCTKLGQWSIGYVDSHKKILQTIPSTPTLIEALNRGVDDRYYLYPNGQDFNPSLKAEMGETEQVLVTQEEQEIYHLMDSSYEECKLCYERHKDTKIEPCGHLICRQCLEQIRKQTKAECPWCRREIRSNVNVSIQASANQIVDKQSEEQQTSQQQQPSTSYEFPIHHFESKSNSNQSGAKPKTGASTSRAFGDFEFPTGVTVKASDASYNDNMLNSNANNSNPVAFRGLRSPVVNPTPPGLVTNGAYASETLPMVPTGSSAQSSEEVTATTRAPQPPPPRPVSMCGAPQQFNPQQYQQQSHTTERKSAAGSKSKSLNPGRKGNKNGRYYENTSTPPPGPSTETDPSANLLQMGLFVELPPAEPALDYLGVATIAAPRSGEVSPNGVVVPTFPSPSREPQPDQFPPDFFRQLSPVYINANLELSANEDEGATSGPSCNKKDLSPEAPTAVNNRNSESSIPTPTGSAAVVAPALLTANGVNENVLSSSSPSLSICNPTYSSFT